MIDFTHSLLSRRALAALLLSFAAATPALAEQAQRASPKGEAAKDQPGEARRLPADVTTDHTVELAGRTLRFKAIAGSIPINNGEGKLQAEIAYIAYVQPESAAARPLTFV